MAPSLEILDNLLQEKTKDVFESDERPTLTVRLIRQKVVEENELDADFVTSSEWKARSKKVIQETVQQLLDLEEEQDQGESEADESEPKPSPKKRGVKRQPPEGDDDAGGKKKRVKKEQKVAAEKPARKRRTSKKAATLGNDDAKPEPKKAKKRGGSTKKVISDDEAEKDEDEPPQEPTKGRKARNPISDEDDELSDPPAEEEDEDEKPKPKPKEATNPISKNAVSDDDDNDLSDPPTEKSEKLEPTKNEDEVMKDIGSEKETDAKSEDAAPVEDENEYSDVIDEGPKPKRKSKGSKAAKEKGKEVKEKGKETKEKGKRGRKPSAAKASAELSVDDQDIKRLQGYLVKCGVRKIWAFELKEYGGDGRGKVRHLKNLLQSIGMDGRFSEAKAAAIKEQRELMADLEAVKEGEKNWGVGGRASRSRAKKGYRMSSDSENEGGGDDDDKDGSEGGGDGDGDDGENGKSYVKPKASRWKEQQAALAALLDSDSD